MGKSAVRHFEMRGFAGLSWTRLGAPSSEDEWLLPREVDDEQLFARFSRAREVLAGSAEFGIHTAVTVPVNRACRGHERPRARAGVHPKPSSSQVQTQRPDRLQRSRDRERVVQPADFSKAGALQQGALRLVGVAELHAERAPAPAARLADHRAQERPGLIDERRMDEEVDVRRDRLLLVAARLHRPRPDERPGLVEQAQPGTGAGRLPRPLDE